MRQRKDGRREEPFRWKGLEKEGKILKQSKHGFLQKEKESTSSEQHNLESTSLEEWMENHEK